MFFLKFLNFFHVIGLEKRMVTFIIGFENIKMTSAKIVKLSGCDSLKIFYRGGNSHLVGFEFCNVYQKCARSIHGRHKPNLFKDNSINFFENKIIFPQLPEIFGAKISQIKIIPFCHRCIAETVPFVRTCTFSQIEFLRSLILHRGQESFNKIKICGDTNS